MSLFQKKLSCWRRGLVLLIFSAIFIYLCIRQSSSIGRLSSYPLYDDCVYLYHGAKLLKFFEYGQIVNAIQQLKHSPFSASLAAISFAVFGFHYISPYLGNSIIVIAYLGGLSWFFRCLSITQYILALALFLTPPFITMGVVEFRPDIAWAVVTGFGVAFIVTSNGLFHCLPRAVITGVLLSLSLLIKPTTFAMTIILYVGAILSQLIPAFRQEKFNAFRTIWKGVGIFLATALILVLPYWILFGQHIWNYFIVNSFGKNKEIWVFRGNFSENLLFYIVGEGGKSNIRMAGLIIAILGFASFLYLAIKRPDLRWKLFSLVFLVGCAFFINTMAQMKSPFLGGGIYGLWLFGSAFVIATACHQITIERRNTYFQTVLLALAALAAISLYRFPVYSDWRNDWSRFENFHLANEYMTFLLEAHKDHLPHSILFSQSGPIVKETTGLWFLFRNKDVKLKLATFSRAAEAFQQSYANWDWIILQEQQTLGSLDRAPVEKLLPEFLKIVQADPNYQLISEFVALDGKKVWIYARESG